MLDFLRAIYRRVPCPPSTNFNLNQLIHDPFAMMADGGVVLDVGSKSAQGQYAFAKQWQPRRILSLDIFNTPGVNLVCFPTGR